MAQLPGAPRIEGYELLGILGEGGMGRVWRARRFSDDRLVAVKVMLPVRDELGGAFLRRFQREIDVSKEFAHPNVIKVLDGGRLDDGCPYLVTELLTGCTLREHDDFGRISPALARHVLHGLVAGFRYIHPRGLVHRDVKPSNVFLDADEGRVILIDFGLVHAAEWTRITATTETPGTWLTMAPEQLGGGGIDALTDAFALGATLHLALTGQAPYDTAVLIGYASGAVAPTPPALARLRPDLPSGLCELVDGLLRLDRKARYGTEEELHALLRDLDAGLPVKLRSRPRRSRPAASLAVSGRHDAVTAGTAVASRVGAGGAHRSPILLAFLALLLALGSFLAATRTTLHRESSSPDRRAEASELLERLLTTPTVELADEAARLGALVRPGDAADLASDELRGLARIVEEALRRGSRRLPEALTLLVARHPDDALASSLAAVTDEASMAVPDDQRGLDEALERAMRLPAAPVRRAVAAVLLARRRYGRYCARTPSSSLRNRELQGFMEIPNRPDDEVTACDDLLAPHVLADLPAPSLPARVALQVDLLMALRTPGARQRCEELVDAVAGRLADQGAWFRPVFLPAAVFLTLHLRGPSDETGLTEAGRRNLPRLELLAAAAPDPATRNLITIYEAWCRIRARQFDEAADTLQRVDEQALPSAERWRLLRAWGKLHEDTGRRVEARDAYQKGLDRATDEELAVWFRRKRFETGITEVFFGQ